MAATNVVYRSAPAGSPFAKILMEKTPKNELSNPAVTTRIGMAMYFSLMTVSSRPWRNWKFFNKFRCHSHGGADGDGGDDGSYEGFKNIRAHSRDITHVVAHVYRR